MNTVTDAIDVPVLSLTVVHIEFGPRQCAQPQPRELYNPLLNCKREM